MNVWRFGVGLVLSLVAWHCAHAPPAQVEKVDVEQIRGCMREQVLPQGYAAEVRLTSFDSSGRVRTKASLALQQPNKLRYEVVAPHGATAQVLVTDGMEFQFFDVLNGRFYYGPAEAGTLESVWGMEPMGLTTETWVKLLLGSIDVPTNAQWENDDGRGRWLFRWVLGAHDIAAQIGRETCRLTGLAMFRGSSKEVDIAIRQRNDRGVPTELEIDLVSTKRKVSLELRDVAYDVALTPAVFHLDPPSGVTPEYVKSRNP